MNTLISRFFAAVLVVGLVFLGPSLRAGEHPGEEHGGKPAKQGEKKKEEQEHGGKPAKKDEKKKKGEEHGGKPADKKKKVEEEEHPGDQSKVFTADQIKTAMREHIQRETSKNGGIFVIRDEKRDFQTLRLRFVKIHDPVRQIEGKGYFACTDFEVAGETGKLYDLDFWLNPKGGNLAVTATKIHKEPKWEDEQWRKWARYTFIKDEVVEIK